MMAKANEFQREIGTFLKHKFEISYRLDDSSTNRFGNFQVSLKDFDFFGATSQGKFWGAEVKRTKSIRFPLNNIQVHQREALIKLEDAHCLAWMFINWRLPRTGSVVWIPFGEYTEIEYINLSKNRKSLKLEDFDPKWYLERITGGWSVPETHPLYNI